MICKKCGERFSQGDKYCKKCQSLCSEQVKLNNYSMDKDFVLFMNNVGVKCEELDLKSPTIAVPSNMKEEDNNIIQDKKISDRNSSTIEYNINKKEKSNNSDRFRTPDFPDELKSYYDERINNIDSDYISHRAQKYKNNEENIYKYNKTTIYVIIILIIAIIVSVVSMFVMYLTDRKEIEQINSIITNISTNVTENNIDEIIIDENNTDTTDITNFSITTSTIITSTLPDYLNSDVITNTEQYTEGEIFCEDNEEQDYDLYGDENNKYDKLESEDENYLKSFALDIDKLVNNYE